MTTGPRNTPHPIILHVDANGNPVRLAEASSIYVTTVSAVSISATNYLGLGNLGGPEGEEGSIQFKSNNGFDGKEEFKYDENNFTLIVPNINSTNTTTASNLRSTTTSSTNLSAVNIIATSISATTVCATNYDTLLNALSFENLDNRYLNSSGDSVTGSIYIQNLSSTNLSATYWLNLPSSFATWNANAIQGISVTSTQPTLGQTLIYKDGIWQPSSIAGAGGGGSPDGSELSIQFRNGSFFSGVDSIKYNSSISGIQSIGLSSTNLSSVNYRGTTISAVTVCAAVVSATTYQNLGKDIAQWNANRIYDTAFDKSELISGDFITYNGATAWTNTRKENAAELVSPQLHTETWNASGLRGVSVTSTSPTTNNVLIYNGSVWTPSSAISLGTVSATNLGGTNIVGTSASIVSVSSTNLSSVSARITGLSATTISAINWQGLPSAVATWNASAIRGSEILTIDSTVTGNALGAFVYSRATNQYYTLPFSSTAIAGTRTFGDTAAQGQVVASYLGSATPSLQINPVFATINDFPENNDVLVFSSALYGIGGQGWTWQQPSSLITPTTAAGPFAGHIQINGPAGQFSSIPGFYINTATSSVSLPKDLYLDYPDSYIRAKYITATGSFETNYIQSYGGAGISGTANFPGTLYAANLSATVIDTPYLKLFTKTTATGQIPERLNQTITYDPQYSIWKPGYTVFQATGAPVTASGADGDIWFQYLP